MFPIPATSDWSSSASPNQRVPSAPREAREHLVEPRWALEDVGAEPLERARVQLEHRPVPEHALERLAAEHEPRLAGSRLTARPQRPASGHAQMRAEHDPALEAKQQVLADRLDRLEHAPVDALGDALRLRARVRRLRLDALADERLQPSRRPVKGIALGHVATLEA